MDGDTSQTPAGPYPYLASYTPAAGDRVLLARVGVSGKFVIQGKVCKCGKRSHDWASRDL
ncbi:hypothetical protein GCM10025857_68390 [Alicyclobacillus contaminans]|nr:hypothetical protein GCM10025857_68390 [Alicyclobacillus contaminans]